jgi:diadenosine tetraphosphate (Ap4A) HIT family hydrolase
LFVKITCKDAVGKGTAAVQCPFCQLSSERIIAQNEHAFVIRDAFPVSPGHTLIIPRQHIASFFETTAEEKTALLKLLNEAKAGIESEYKPASYNIGINDGAAAGQTVPHLHIHLIPRYEGDVEDPRGGVRWVVPEKARYWD